MKKTIESIHNQTYKDYEIIVIHDKDRKGANWARNKGAKQANGDYLFFCDDDVELESWALEKLLETLVTKNEAYAYGWFRLGTKTKGDRGFCPDMLRTCNFISTMSLVRKDIFLEVGGFDESFTRLQDWDLWLTMLDNGYRGAYCGLRIFKTTKDPDGISSDKNTPYEEALKMIEKKHKIGRNRESSNLHNN